MKNNLIKSKSLISLPTPKNISFLWNMGFLLGMCLVLQIISGIMLSMNYQSSVTNAYDSIIHIMRDIESGWILRLLHLNGASFYFIFIYIHIFRGIFFNSPRKTPFVWISGVIIFFTSTMTAFMGYVLPWGQMSYWGATVITSMLTSIPYIGGPLIMWLWGDFSVTEPMLNRMLSLHFLLPFILVAFVLLHLIILHFSGSSSPSITNTNMDKMKFFPYFILKDILPFFVMCFVMSYLICVDPFKLGDPENFNYASIYTTPTHIKPEWYFLFAYAILRCIPSKLGGVIMMLLSILILLIFMISMKKSFNTLKYTPFKKLLCFSFFFCAMLLTVMGGKPVNDVTMLSTQIMTMFYFLVCMIMI